MVLVGMVVVVVVIMVLVLVRWWWPDPAADHGVVAVLVGNHRGMMTFPTDM